MIDWAAVDRHLAGQEAGLGPEQHYPCGCVSGGKAPQHCDRARGYLAEARTAHADLARQFTPAGLERLNDAFERLREHLGD